MNKNNMFNQKLEQIGGENIVDGITLKIEDKEKILNFINANTNQNYTLNDNKLACQCVVKNTDQKTIYFQIGALSVWHQAAKKYGTAGRVASERIFDSCQIRRA